MMNESRGLARNEHEDSDVRIWLKPENLRIWILQLELFSTGSMRVPLTIYHYHSPCLYSISYYYYLYKYRYVHHRRNN